MKLRTWWAALAGIVFLAGVLRFTGYDFGLPYIDHPDEPHFYLLGEMRFEQGRQLDYHTETYPPGYFTFYYLVQRLFNDTIIRPAEQVARMRAVSVLVSLAAVVCVAWLAYTAAGFAAGLFAAGFWAVQPMVVAHSRYATPDNYAVLGALLALVCGAQAIRTRRPRWFLGATVCALLAFVFKYPAGAVLPAAVGVPAFYLLRAGTPAGRRALWITLGACVLVTLVAVAWVLWGYGAAYNTLGNTAQTGGSTFHLPTWDLMHIQLNRAMVGYEAVWTVGVLGLAVCVWLRDEVDGWVLGAVGGGGLGFLLLVASFGPLPFHNLYPLAAILTILWGVGAAAYIPLAEALMARMGQDRRLGAAAAAILGTLILASLANTAWLQTQHNALPDYRVDVMHWADRTLPPGPYLAGSMEYHKVFNHAWGGYKGESDFALHRVAPLTEEPIEVWRTAGVQYALLTYADYQALDDSYMHETLRLKTFPPSAARRGPATVVLRLYPIRELAGVNFGGEIELVGCDLSTDRARAGEMIFLAPYWRALSQPSTDYQVFNHLVPLDSMQIVAQADGPPLLSMRRPTSTWDDPDEVFIGRPFIIELGEVVASGRYRLIIGLYDPAAGRRLTAAKTGLDYYEVARIAVE